RCPTTCASSSHRRASARRGLPPSPSPRACSLTRTPAAASRARSPRRAAWSTRPARASKRARSRRPSPCTSSVFPPPAPPPAASLALRLPTQVNLGGGQFTLLRNLAGNPLSVGGNEPVDHSSPTVDVVRAARAAEKDALNNGFLLDLEQPRVLGDFAVQVTQ